MLKIIKVHPNSIAEEIGMRVNDQLVTINNNEIQDQIDYNYYICEENVEILIGRDIEQILFEIEKEYDEDIGIELSPMKIRSCGNKCIFCFTDQNPDGLRRTLYFKDEDYRFSFLNGNYVTLTSVKQKELERIVKQKLSPLYISVHSTEEKSRKQLLGLKKNDHLLEKIEFLVKRGIEIHAQVVLCPGLNDGVIFENTVDDLKEYYPGLKSIAIVPVGLTRFREKLFPLRLNTVDEMENLIRYSNNLRKRLVEEMGTQFIYLADEFYLKTKIPLPDSSYYDDFYQIENGVGEFRYFIDDFIEQFFLMPREVKMPLKITWVTGVLAAETLEKFILTKLRTIKNMSIDLIPIDNDFFGKSITVSGLIVGQDIYNQLRNKKLGDMILLPPKVLNHEGLFLDDWTVERLENKLGLRCVVYNKPIRDFINTITNIRKSA